MNLDNKYVYVNNLMSETEKLQLNKEKLGYVLKGAVLCFWET